MKIHFPSKLKIDPREGSKLHGLLRTVEKFQTSMGERFSMKISLPDLNQNLFIELTKNDIEDLEEMFREARK